MQKTTGTDAHGSGGFPAGTGDLCNFYKSSPMLGLIEVEVVIYNRKQPNKSLLGKAQILGVRSSCWANTRPPLKQHWRQSPAAISVCLSAVPQCQHGLRGLAVVCSDHGDSVTRPLAGEEAEEGAVPWGWLRVRERLGEGGPPGEAPRDPTAPL